MDQKKFVVTAGEAGLLRWMLHVVDSDCSFRRRASLQEFSCIACTIKKSHLKEFCCRGDQLSLVDGRHIGKN